MVEPLHVLDELIPPIQVCCGWDLPAEHAEALLADGFAKRFCEVLGAPALFTHGIVRTDGGRLRWAARAQPDAADGVVVTADEAALWSAPAAPDAAGRVLGPNVIVSVGAPVATRRGRRRVMVRALHQLFDGSALFTTARKMFALAAGDRATAAAPPAVVSRAWLHSCAALTAIPVEAEPPTPALFYRPSPSAAEMAAAFALFPPMERCDAVLHGLAGRVARDGTRLSANDVATARVWRALLRARVGAGVVSRDAESHLIVALDLRQLLPAPQVYLGNMSSCAFASARVGDVLDEAEDDAALRVRRAVVDARDGIALRAVAYALHAPSLDHCTQTWSATVGTAHVGVTNWSRMKPAAIAPGFDTCTPPGGLSAFDGIAVLSDVECDDESAEMSRVMARVGAQCRYADLVRKALN
jgi:hypothetical protein